MALLNLVSLHSKEKLPLRVKGRNKTAREEAMQPSHKRYITSKDVLFNYPVERRYAANI